MKIEVVFLSWLEQYNVCSFFLASKSSPSSSHLKTGYMKVLFGEKKQKCVHSPLHSDGEIKLFSSGFVTHYLIFMLHVGNRGTAKKILTIVNDSVDDYRNCVVTYINIVA